MTLFKGPHVVVEVGRQLEARQRRERVGQSLKEPFLLGPDFLGGRPGRFLGRSGSLQEDEKRGRQHPASLPEAARFDTIPV
jgi:hypothetical protein